MREVPVKNTGKTNLHVAGVVIVPGETKMLPASMVPARFLPEEEAEPAAPVAQTDQTIEILKGTVAKVADVLPALTSEQLDALETAEAAGAQRKGVLEAIAADRLRRAALADGQGQ